MKRVLLISLVVVTLAVIVAGGLWWRHDRRTRSFYTDGSQLQQPISNAFVREVLWLPPTALSGQVNSPLDDSAPRVSADGSTLLLVRGRGGDSGENADIFMAQRQPAGDWSEPQPLYDINTEHDEFGPVLSPDGHTLLFVSNRPDGGIGGSDLWMTTRTEFGWGAPVNLGSAINSAADESSPALSADGLTLLFASNRPADDTKAESDALTRRACDLYSANVTLEGFERAAPLVALNAARDERSPAFSPSGDFLYFCSDRSGGNGGFDLYRSRRVDGRQLPAEHLGKEINTAANEKDPAPDMGGFALIFSSDREPGLEARDPRPEATNSQASSLKPQPDFNLWRSESREVFVKVGPRQPIDLAAIWAWLAPLLLWVLLLLTGVALLIASWKGIRSHRLSLLTRCALASLIAHLAIMVLLTFWQVTTQIAGLMDEGGTRVVLTSHAADSGAGGLGGQIRGRVTDVTAIQGQEADAAARTEHEVSSGAPEASLVQMAARGAQLPAEEQARLEAMAREAEVQRSNTLPNEETDLQSLAMLQQSTQVQAPADAHRDVSREAAAQAQGGQAPHIARTTALPAPEATESTSASVQPIARPGESAAPISIAAAPTEANAPSGGARLPSAAPSIDARAFQPVDVQRPGEGEAVRVAEAGGPSAPSSAAGQAGRAAQGGSGTSAAAPSAASVLLAPSSSAGGSPEQSSISGAGGLLAAAGVSESAAPAGRAEIGSDSSSALAIGTAASGAPASIAAPGEVAPVQSGGAEGDAGAMIASAAGQSGGRASNDAATGAPRVASSGALHTTVAPTAGGAEALTGGGAQAARESDGVSGAAGGALTPSSATTLDGALTSMKPAGDVALPTDGQGVAAGAGVAASQPGVAMPGSALAANTARRGGSSVAVGGPGSTSSGAVSVDPRASISSPEESLTAGTGGAAVRDATLASSGGAAPAPDGTGSIDQSLPPALSTATLSLPGEGAAGAQDAAGQEGGSGSGALVAAAQSSGRSERGIAGGAAAPSQTVNIAPGAPSDGAMVESGEVVAGARGGNVAESEGGGASTASPPAAALGEHAMPKLATTGTLSLPGETGDAPTVPAAPAGQGDGPGLNASRGAVGSSRRAGTTGRETSADSRSVAIAPGPVSASDLEQSPSSSSRGGSLDVGESSGSIASPPALALAKMTMPGSASPEPDLNLRLPTDLAPPNNPYSARKEETRLETVKRMGGSEETEKAVAMALEWLARHQAEDGRWAARNFDVQCHECADEGKFDTDIATTGLALLCFLGADHTHVKQGKYQTNVQRGLKWLLDHQQLDGDLRGEETMYSHGIASIALGEALGMTGDEQLREPVTRAVAFIDAARNRNVGGWRYEPRQAGDTSVMGWQVMALMSAKRAGLQPAAEAFAAAGAWLEKVGHPDRAGQYAYQPGQPPSPSMTAEGMFVQQLLGVPHDDPRQRGSVEVVSANPPRWEVEPNTYYWYYATLAMFQHQGESWEKWNKTLTEVLLKNQRTSGTASGSWDPVDNWAKIGGRVYQTAICTLCLEVYYRYLPMYQAPLLADSKSAVRGTVTDASTGKPLAGAMVRLDMSSGSGALVASTDASGRYALALPELPAEFVALSASMDGYTPATTNIAAAEARNAAVTRDFALAPTQSNVIVLEDEPEVHHLGNNEFEGSINSQFQKRAEGLEYSDRFTLEQRNHPPRVTRATVVLMAKGAQAQNPIHINGERLAKRLNGSPRDGSFGEFTVEIPLDLLREGVNTIAIRSSNSEGDLDDFEFVNVQIHLE